MAKKVVDIIVDIGPSSRDQLKRMLKFRGIRAKMTDGPTSYSTKVTVPAEQADRAKGFIKGPFGLRVLKAPSA